MVPFTQFQELLGKSRLCAACLCAERLRDTPGAVSGINRKTDNHVLITTKLVFNFSFILH